MLLNYARVRCAAVIGEAGQRTVILGVANDTHAHSGVALDALGPRVGPGGGRRSQEVAGGTRGNQGDAGRAWKSQEEAGGARRKMEEAGGVRRSQGESGGAKSFGIQRMRRTQGVP